MGHLPFIEIPMANKVQNKVIPSQTGKPLLKHDRYRRTDVNRNKSPCVSKSRPQFHERMGHLPLIEIPLAIDSISTQMSCPRLAPTKQSEKFDQSNQKFFLVTNQPEYRLAARRTLSKARTVEPTTKSLELA